MNSRTARRIMSLVLVLPIILIRLWFMGDARRAQDPVSVILLGAGVMPSSGACT